MNPYLGEFSANKTHTHVLRAPNWPWSGELARPQGWGLTCDLTVPRTQLPAQAPS